MAQSHAETVSSTAKTDKLVVQPQLSETITAVAHKSLEFAVVTTSTVAQKAFHARKTTRNVLPTKPTF